MLEGWTALAYAADRTHRIRLDTMVTGVTYRHPGILIKTATTLDVLSNGRAYFGVGAAWNEKEHRSLGAIWANIIATRCRGFSLGAIALCLAFFWWYSASLKLGV